MREYFGSFPSLLRRVSSTRYINPLCEVYRRHKVEWIDQAENLCQMYVDFSYILVVFSYIDGFLINWINLNKTILQSIYIIFRLFLLFACLKKFERLNQNINSRRFIQFFDDLQTINHLLETINHVLEKCEYENSYSKQN